MKENKLRIHRIYYIDEKIRAGKYPNCNSLARDYEVAPRTIRRDIEYMKDMLKAPVEYDTAKRGYYYTEPNYFISTMDIKEGDLFALCIAEKALQHYENTPLYNRLATVFDKITAHLPDPVKINTTWINEHYTFMRESYTSIKPDVWDALAECLQKRTTAEIAHQKAGAEKPVVRLIDPYHLVNYRGEWYCVAYCHRRKDVILFAMSRIKTAEGIGRFFTVSDDFSLDSYTKSNFGIMSGDEEYRVAVRFSAAQGPYILERTWHPEQQIVENDDGTVDITFPSTSLFEVRRWILSWGSDAQVIGPEILRQQVMEEISSMQGIYTSR